jgi:hypothetical protein
MVVSLQGVSHVLRRGCAAVRDVFFFFIFYFLIIAFLQSTQDT